jgi:3'-phosphoadenosine 5'-phosphosulfate sulfotransferase (PAPS reductase)/FAD synthetase
MQRVFNFSGGATSAYMTLKYYEKGDIVLFQDTGREHPKTHKFINDFEAFEGIPITRIRYKDSERPFDLMLQEKKYKQIPNRMKRICTVELKINTAKRYLKTIGVKEYENFIGFRYDEKTRVENRVQPSKKVHDRFPLFEDKVVKSQINDFWDKKQYKLEIPRILGNCLLCPLKGKNAILAILREFPKVAQEWIDDESMSAKMNKKGRTYIDGVTIFQLREMAQNNLFREFPLEDINPQFNCVCG